MPEEFEYGKMKKRVVFTETDHRHAQFLLKLKYLKITQAKFFRHLITGLIEDDPRLTEYIRDIAYKPKKKKTEKMIAQGERLMEDLGLSDGDVDNIFDVLEQEFPDL